MAAHLVPILDVGWQRTPQRLEFPDGLVAIELWHIVSKRAFELAIRRGCCGALWMSRIPRFRQKASSNFPRNTPLWSNTTPLGMTCHWRMAAHKVAIVVRGSIASKRSQNT